MKVTQVTVTVHEKRNHPHEYGHYDCSVTLTADVGLDLEANDVVALLRAQARIQVIEECDNWQVKITEEKRIAELVSSLEYRLMELRRYASRENLRAHMNKCLDVIRQLPWDDQEKRRRELAGAVLKARERQATDGPESDGIPF